MKKSKSVGLAAAGFLAGIMIGAPTAQAAVEYLQALPSRNAIYVDGQQVQMEAYIINGTNFVKLRDVGEAVGFNVYWDNATGTVQIDSTQDYTGQPPAADTDLDAVRSEMIQRINQVRRENRVQELTVNDALMDAAQQCSDKRYTWHHTQEEGEAVAAHGYPWGFGSNLTVFTGAATTGIVQRAVTNWVNSPGHFQTMTDPDCDSIGVGITTSQGITYCYMFTGKPDTCNPYG